MEGSNSSKKGKNNEDDNKDEKEKQRGKVWRSYVSTESSQIRGVELKFLRRIPHQTNTFYVKQNNLSMWFLLLIRVQRIYDNPTGRNKDGFRILVDRLWPRGLSKDKVKVDVWQKDIAPSNSLRKWFGHDEKKWNEFKRRYFKELDKKNELVNMILCKVKEEESSSSITLLYGTKEDRFNNAVALKEYLDEKAKNVIVS
jgi:uncharacterized protein YeaO (DUF488 family)